MVGHFSDNRTGGFDLVTSYLIAPFPSWSPLRRKLGWNADADEPPSIPSSDPPLLLAAVVTSGWNNTRVAMKTPSTL